MDDDDTTGTAVSITIGQVSISIETSLGLTPEMMEDTLVRARRQAVAAILDLGLVADVPAQADQP